MPTQEFCLSKGCVYEVMLHGMARPTPFKAQVDTTVSYPCGLTFQPDGTGVVGQVRCFKAQNSTNLHPGTFNVQMIYSTTNTVELTAGEIRLIKLRGKLRKFQDIESTVIHLPCTASIHVSGYTFINEELLLSFVHVPSSFKTNFTGTLSIGADGGLVFEE